MKTLLKSIVPALIIVVCLLQCGPGNGSDVGNPKVCGTLYEPDGLTPARGTTVTAWKKSTLAPINDGSTFKTAINLLSAITDCNGNFSLPPFDTGCFCIEGVDGNQNMVLIDSVFSFYSDSTIQLPPDTLKIPGAIRGLIALVAGGNPQQTFILAFGTDRFTQVTPDGTFLFDMLAEGTYTLKIVSVAQPYSAIDINGIKVISNDTTDIDTIELPLKQLPKVEGVIAELDTHFQSVIVSWKKTPSSITKGYSIYRKPAGDESFGPPLNGTMLVIDSSIVDTSFLLPDSSYEYRIAMVDHNNNEGPLSSGALVTVRNTLTPDDSVQLFSDDGSSQLAGFALTGQGNFFIERRCNEQSFVETYSSSGDLQRSYQLPGGYSGMVRPGDDSMTFAWILDKSDRSFYRIDGKGILQRLFAYEGYIGSFDVSGNSLFYVESPGDGIGYVKTYSLTSDSLSYWNDYSGKSLNSLMCDTGGTITVVYKDKTYMEPYTPGTNNYLATIDAQGATKWEHVINQVSAEFTLVSMIPGKRYLLSIPLNQTDTSLALRYRTDLLMYGLDGGNLILHWKYCRPFLADAVLTGDGQLIVATRGGTILKLNDYP